MRPDALRSGLGLKFGLGVARVESILLGSRVDSIGLGCGLWATSRLSSIIRRRPLNQRVWGLGFGFLLPVSEDMN